MLRPGRVFRDCDECPEMVVVPAGSFLMGSPPGEAGAMQQRRPAAPGDHCAAVCGGQFEVTFAEWDACVAAGGCTHTPDDRGWGRASCR